jgi:hypothetical protein
VASAGLEAVARHRLRGGVRVGAIFEWSVRIGAAVNRARGAVARRRAPSDGASGAFPADVASVE